MWCWNQLHIFRLTAGSLRSLAGGDKKSFALLLLAASAALLSACGSWRPADPAEEPVHLAHDREALTALLSSSIAEESLSRPEVLRFVEHYTGVRRRFMAQALERRRRYRAVIDPILVRHGLPLELSSVALVESGFNPIARSPSGAVGMWQLMKTTARGLGLSVSWFVDERRNIEKSTSAAARYLLELRQLFGDWPLALAAYNGGMSRVRGAVRSGGTRDFYELAARGFFYRETREYVPKVYAAMIISRSPRAYGFN